MKFTLLLAIEGAFPEDSLSLSLAQLAGKDSFPSQFWFVSMHASKTVSRLAELAWGWLAQLSRLVWLD
jgi:hypothetical protein